MAVQFILTTAGKSVIVNANHTGTNPVVITEVAIGSGAWTPTPGATALAAEIKRISAIGGGAVAADTIHVTATDKSTDAYTIREVGLYSASGVLLAIYAQADPILSKGAATVALLACDLVITGLPAGSVTVGDTTFSYPQATESTKGVAELATTAEAQAGTDDERILTPKKLQDVTATETRKGVSAIASALEVAAGVEAFKMVTPAHLSILKRAFLESLYPIGELLITLRDGNPSTWLGFGTWGRYAAGRALVGYDAADTDFNEAGKQSGSKTVTLSTAQIPSHSHSIDPSSTTTSSAGSHSHTLANTDTESESSADLTAGEYLVYNTSGSADKKYQLKGSTTLPTIGITGSAGAHSHTLDIAAFDSATTGGGNAHPNVQPSIVVFVWQRTA